MKNVDNYSSTEVLKNAPASIKLLIAIKKEFVWNENYFKLLFLFKFFCFSIMINQYSYVINKNELAQDNSNHTWFDVLEFFSLYKKCIFTKIVNYIISISTFFLIFIFLSVYLYLNNKSKTKYVDLFDDRISKCLIKIFSCFLMFFIFFSHLLIYICSKEIFEFIAFLSKTNNEFEFSSGILVINIISILVLNEITYRSFLFINEPHFNSIHPIKIRAKRFIVFYINLLLNLICLHHLDTYDIKNFKIAFEISLIILIAFLIIAIIKNFFRFQFRTRVNQIIKFFICFIIISFIVELIVNYTIFIIKEFEKNILFLFVKFCFTMIFSSFHDKMVKKYFKYNCSNSIFRLFQNNLNENTIECLFYFQNLFLENKIFTKLNKESYQTKENHHISTNEYIAELNFMRNNLKSFDEDKELMNHILDILIDHMIKCSLKNCNCYSLRTALLIDNNLTLENYFENIFLHIGYIKKPTDILFLFSDYLFYSYDADLFGYSILITYLYKNIKTIQISEQYQIYQLILKFINSHFEKKMNSFTQLNIFQNIFRDIVANEKLSKRILIFNKNFNKLLGYSEKFLYDIKFNQIKDSNIISKSNEIIEVCKNYFKEFKKIKKYLIKIFVNKNLEIKFELKYKLKLFFKIFSYNIPKKLLQVLSFKVNTLESFDKSKDFVSMNSQINIGLHDLPLLNEKFFNKILKNNQVIFEINKLFRIKYFSINLAQALGYDLDYLINNDIHSILPEKLKENHKKVILQNLIVHKNIYFVKKTFAFTSFNKLLPVQLKVVPFPNLSESIIYLANIEVVAKKKKSQITYNFILDDEFDLISSTQNLEDDFCIYYDLLKKINMSVLKIFDIHSSAILDKFESQLKIISSEKDKAIFNSIFQNIFNLNLKEEKLTNVKIQTFNEEESISMECLDQSNNKLDLSSKPSENLSFISSNLLNMNNQKLKQNRLFDKILEFETSNDGTAGNNKRNDENKQKDSIKKLFNAKHENDQDNSVRKIKNKLFKDFDYNNNDKSNENITQRNSKSNRITPDVLLNKNGLNDSFISSTKKNNKKEKLNDVILNEMDGFKSVSNKEITIYRDFDVLFKNVICLRSKLLEYDPSDINLIKLDNIIENLKNNYYFMKYRKFQITFHLRNFMYTPFFIVSIDEVELPRNFVYTIPGINYNYLNPISFSKNLENENFTVKNFDSPLSSNFLINNQDNINENFSRDSVKTNRPILNLLTHNTDLKSKQIKMKLEHKKNLGNTMIKNDKKFNKSLNINVVKKIKPKTLKQTTLIILIILIIICYCFLFVIYYIKEKYIELGVEGLEILNLLDKQYNSILFLHSTVIGLCYFHSKLNTFSFDFKLEYFMERLKYDSYQIKEYKYLFYSKLLNGNFQSLIENFHSPFNVTKISLNWEEESYVSNYDIEVDKIVSYALTLSFNLKKDTIKEIYSYNNFIKDIKEWLLFNNFKRKLTGESVPKSKFTGYIFYFNENIPKRIVPKIKELEDLIYKQIDSTDKYYKAIINILDILNIISFICTLVLIFYCLNKFNNLIIYSIFSILIVNKDLEMNVKKIDEDIFICHKIIENLNQLIKIFNLNSYNNFFRQERNLSKNLNDKNKRFPQNTIINYMELQQKDTISEVSYLKSLNNEIVKSHNNAKDSGIKQNNQLGLLIPTNHNNNNTLSVISREFSPISKLTSERLIHIGKIKNNELVKKNNDLIMTSKGNVSTTNANLLSNHNLLNNINFTSNLDNSHNLINNISANHLLKKNQSPRKFLQNPLNTIKNSKGKNEILSSDSLNKNQLFFTLDFESVQKYFLQTTLQLIRILKYALIILFLINFSIHLSIIIINIISFNEKGIFLFSTKYMTKRYSVINLVNNIIRLDIFKNEMNSMDLEPIVYFNQYETIKQTFISNLRNYPNTLVESNLLNNILNKNTTNFTDNVDIEKIFRQKNFNSKGIEVSSDTILNVNKNLFRDFKEFINTSTSQDLDNVFISITDILNRNENSFLNIEIDFAIEKVVILHSEAIKNDYGNLGRFLKIMLYLYIISIVFESVFFIIFFYISFWKLRNLIKHILFTSRRYKYRLNQRFQI